MPHAFALKYIQADFQHIMYGIVSGGIVLLVKMLLLSILSAGYNML